MDSVASSKNLKAPEIILQTANVYFPEKLKNGSLSIHDGVIPKEASLAQGLMDFPKSPKEKVFIGVPEMHNVPLKYFSLIGSEINRLLQTSS